MVRLRADGLDEREGSASGVGSGENAPIRRRAARTNVQTRFGTENGSCRASTSSNHRPTSGVVSVIDAVGGDDDIDVEDEHAQRRLSSGTPFVEKLVDRAVGG